MAIYIGWLIYITTLDFRTEDKTSPVTGPKPAIKDKPSVPVKTNLNNLGKTTGV